MPLLTADQARDFLAEHRRGTLATIKSSDGRPQISNIAYATLGETVGISVTTGRAKVANVRRDPRVSLHVSSADFWTYVVAEGDAELSPPAREAGDATCRRLLDIYEVAAGKPHPDPDEFHQAMVDEQRLVLSFVPTRLYPTR